MEISDKTKVSIGMRNLYCYSCSQFFQNSHNFQHTCSTSSPVKSIEPEIPKEEPRRIHKKILKRSHGKSKGKGKSQHTSKKRPSHLPLDSSINSATRKKSKRNPLQSSQSTNCLEKPDKIRIHCWVCSTNFTSLQKLLHHLDPKNCLNIPSKSVNNHQNLTATSQLSPSSSPPIESNPNDLSNPEIDPNPNTPLPPLAIELKPENITEFYEPDCDFQTTDHVKHEESSNSSDFENRNDPEFTAFQSDTDTDSSVESSGSREFKIIVDTPMKQKKPRRKVKKSNSPDSTLVHNLQNPNSHPVENTAQNSNQNPTCKPRPFKCSYPGCDKSFSTKRLCNKHLTVHTTVKPFKCTFTLEDPGEENPDSACGRQFSTKDQLKSHENTHTRKIIFECPHSNCDKTFLEKSKLTTHLRNTIHTQSEGDSIMGNPITPFKCPVDECGKYMGSAGSLKRHEKVHSGLKESFCDQCGKGFSNVSSLNTHMRGIHEGVKEWLCPHCGVSFPWSGGYRRHLRIHSGEKPFKCKKCDSSFRLDYQLTKHMVLHTGQELKTWVCEVQDCQRSFTWKHTYQRHMRRTHGITAINCERVI